jgi:hypothetical protein
MKGIDVKELEDNLRGEEIAEQMEQNSDGLEKWVMSLVETVKPSNEAIVKEIEDLRRAHPNLNRDEIAQNFADKICWLYSAEGAATALPGAIPGIGTLAQVGIEGSAILADLGYMLRFMAEIVYGVACIYGRDMDAPFNQDFVRVLGLWCGVLNLTKGEAVRISSKIAIAQFKTVPGKIFQRINRKVGTTIVTKYGTKRGGIAVGRLIPFGVGAIVGGGFNLATMKGFKNTAIHYYKSDDCVLTEV